MKDKDAKAALGLDDRVTELFLMGNMADISRTIRQWIMQAKFYGIDAQRLANFLAKEVLWQDEVRKSYVEHSVAHNLPCEALFDRSF